MIVVFENSISGACPQGFNEFQYIAIGNNTAIEIVNAIMTELDTSVANLTKCVISISDEMAKKEITLASSDFTPATSGTGAIVVLDTSSSSFNFDAGALNTCMNQFQLSYNQ